MELRTSGQPSTPGCGSAAPRQAGTLAGFYPRVIYVMMYHVPWPPGLRVLAHGVIRGVGSPEPLCGRFLFAQTSRRNVLAVDNRHCLQITLRHHFSPHFCAQQAAITEELVGKMFSCSTAMCHGNPCLSLPELSLKRLPDGPSKIFLRCQWLLPCPLCPDTSSPQAVGGLMVG